MGVQDETRMMTSASPLARARMRAQGVVGRLRRMLIDKVGGEFEATQILPPSPGLAQAMQRVVPGDSAGAGFYVSGNSRPGAVYMDASHVEKAAVVLRQRRKGVGQPGVGAATHQQGQAAGRAPGSARAAPTTVR